MRLSPRLPTRSDESMRSYVGTPRLPGRPARRVAWTGKAWCGRVVLVGKSSDKGKPRA